MNTQESDEYIEKRKGKLYDNEDVTWGNIQWKGTDVCMDIHCKCGYMAHLDADFAYYVICPECKRVYELCPVVEMIEIDNHDMDRLMHSTRIAD